ncbi:SusD/RagB family nutrient-binding outer membrane lipoprotein [Carboxylicivirga mesophila]|uniref:SusD/RagB family nutrient-binding outer membrane lipoprotein n=1 Tax=Carboxylicivirga mesophila TaxID=1166478 RepID=A0ABS5K618_9BACT|nr:SusD/RagB family nutrient-binding outer membrane lipoprotein [Carboxylicivirga mesophila]MBS2210396.1 SusD/RagB family nutrient-binding outer membrane lipoprotein [Carboxylicivirga mesophila]
MKKLNIILFAAVLTMFSACTDEFDTINDNPNRVTDLDAGFQFGKIQLMYAGNGHEEWRGNLIMTGPISGITQCGYRTGQSFGLSDGFSEAKWSAIYTNVVKDARDMQRTLTEKDEDGSNIVKLAQTDIVLQLAAQRLTDLYGDIPYSEGGLGFNELNYYPAYDSQEDVYKGMVEKLRAARQTLLSDNGESFGSHDLIYGHLDNDSRRKSWAKLANSLLLRIGMRASNADPAWAKEVVEEAAAHSAGFITGVTVDEGAALLKHSTNGGPWGIHENGAGSAINGKVGGFAYAYVGEEYLRLAQQNEDPRLFYTACQVVNQDGEFRAWTGQTYFNPFEEAARPGEAWKPVVFNPEKGGADESFSVRGLMKVEGVQVFTDYFVSAGSLGDTVEVKQGDNVLYEYIYNADYAQYRTLCAVNPETVGSRTAPSIFFTGDETYFILAEAAAKGWTVPGDAATNLAKAVELNISKYPALYNESSSPETYMSKYAATSGDTRTYEEMAADYIANLGVATVETIQLERWKSLFLNGYEAFALWNRTLVSVTPVGIPYDRNIELPEYQWDNIKDALPGVEQTPDAFFSTPFHNGGITGGVRPRRLDYPDRERMNNTANINAAMERQSAFGNDGDNFISTKMWISK